MPKSPPAPEREQADKALSAPLGSKPPPVRLRIPSLRLDVPVVEVAWLPIFRDGRWQSEWQTADGAAGHHRDSANPGELGNMIISGHHNTRGEVFRQVSEIGQVGSPFGVGDEIVVEAQDGTSYIYVVDAYDRFLADAAPSGYPEQTSGPTLTLVTCWPYETNTHRVVVTATLKP